MKIYFRFLQFKMVSLDAKALKTAFPMILLVNALEAKVCIESLPTIQLMTHCPQNYTELQLAVQRKRCDVLANTQTCVRDPNEFVYHCLVNQQADVFVEVCAPKWLLAGYCGYFDTVLNRIETNVKRDCTLFAEPCPSIFNSSDLYKYQGCLKLIKKEEEDEREKEKENVCPSTSINHAIWIVPSLIAFAFMVAFYVSFPRHRIIIGSKGNNVKEEEDTSENCENGELDRLRSANVPSDEVVAPKVKKRRRNRRNRRKTK